jgi:Right handed beta helix region
MIKPGRHCRTTYSFIIALALILPALPENVASAATYYVATTGSDSNTCAQARNTSTPRATPASGAACLTAPGDVLQIRGGTYASQLFESNIGTSGTSWANPVTIMSYPGETATLRPSTSQGNVARFRDGSRAYIILDRLVLDGINAGGGAGGSVVSCGSTSHHLRVSNSEIKNGEGNGVLCGGTNHEFINLKVHHNGLSTAYTNSNGMYMYTDNTVIDGGEFYHNECYGVRFLDSDSTKSADNNIVRNAKVYSNGYGKGLSGASVCGSGGGGIVLGNDNNSAYNNLVYGNLSGIEVMWGTPSATKIYNNTIYNNTPGGGIIIGSAATDTAVTNNIVWANGGTISNSGTRTVLQTNLMTNPLFVNAAALDFNLLPTSPVIDAGTTLATVSTDKDGVSRPQGSAYDIGARELIRNNPPPAAPANLRAK